MKILYLTDLLSPYRVEWMNLLEEKNQVTAYYYDDEEQTREHQWLNCKTAKFDTQKISNHTIKGIRFSRETMQLLKNTKYDIYIVDGYASLIQVQAILWLTKKKYPVYVNIDGIDLWKKNGLIGCLKESVKKILYKSGANFLCGSQIAAKYIIAQGAKEKNVFVHPFTSLHQYDLLTPNEKVTEREKCRKLISVDGSRIVVAVGRFISLKRFEDLLMAWKNVPEEYALYLIGGGEEKEHYLQLVKELELTHVHILDFMLPDQLNQYYCAADLLVHPSESETWGLVLNEAMAKGCAVICTNQCVAGVELIRDGVEGYIVPVGDVAQLHNRICELLNNPSKCSQMGCAALERISSYTYENMVQIHENIFKRSGHNETSCNKC